MIKTYVVLRSLAILFASGLVICTAILAFEAARANERQDHAILDGASPLVLLHEEPDKGSGVEVVLERGTRVTMERIKDFGAEVWFFVRSGESAGWVESASLHPANP